MVATPDPVSPSLRKRPAAVAFSLSLDAPPVAVAATVPDPEKRLALKFLNAPTRDQKPPLQKRRAGFSKAPSKPQPRPQFSTKAIGQNPGDAAAKALEALAAKAAKAQEVPDSAFITWIKAGQASRPDTQQARNYLLLGAPFMGEHDFEKKEAVRDAGAVWCRNPLKAEDCEDRRVRFGWYSAPNERILEALLELAPRDKPNKWSGGTNLCHAWSPRDCPGNSIRGAILELLAEHAIDAARQNKEDREAGQKAQEDRERLQRARDSAAGRSADGEAEIARLRDQYGVEWGATLSHAAASAPCLGPSTGISDVERVLRGLDLEVVRAEDVRALRFDDRAASTGAKLPAADPSQSGPGSNDAPERDYNLQPYDAPVLLFGRKHPWMILPTTDSEWKKLREQSCVRVEHDPCVPPRITRCEGCLQVVMEQFGDCGCEETGSWYGCRKCGAVRYDQAAESEGAGALQECACVDLQGWERAQARAQADANDGRAGAFNGQGEENDCGPEPDDWGEGGLVAPAMHPGHAGAEAPPGGGLDGWLHCNGGEVVAY